jgi:hypothetical protein
MSGRVIKSVFNAKRNLSIFELSDVLFFGFSSFYINSVESKHEFTTRCMTFLNATYVNPHVGSLCTVFPPFDFLLLNFQIRTVSYVGRTKGFMFFLLLLVA